MGINASGSLVYGIFLGYSDDLYAREPFDTDASEEYGYYEYVEYLLEKEAGVTEEDRENWRSGERERKWKEAYGCVEVSVYGTEYSSPHFLQAASYRSEWGEVIEVDQLAIDPQWLVWLIKAQAALHMEEWLYPHWFLTSSYG